MKKNITISVDEEVIESVRNMVYWSPDLTMSHVFEFGAKNFVELMELENGEKFKPRQTDLKSGRKPRF